MISSSDDTNEDTHCKICEPHLLISEGTLQEHLTKEHYVKRWGEFPIEIYKKCYGKGEIELDDLKDPLEPKNQKVVPEMQPIPQLLEGYEFSNNQPDQNLTVPTLLHEEDEAADIDTHSQEYISTLPNEVPAGSSSDNYSCFLENIEDDADHTSENTTNQKPRNILKIKIKKKSATSSPKRLPAQDMTQNGSCEREIRLDELPYFMFSIYYKTDLFSITFDYKLFLV